MVVFALLMVAASYAMIRKIKMDEKKPAVSNLRISLIGFGVGLLTEFLGAGGGFLIIPSLFFFAGLDMKQSVGTSLFIIAIYSLTGLLRDVIKGEFIDYGLLLSISACAIAGMIGGTLLAKKFQEKN